MRAAISHRMDSAFQSTLPTRGSDPFLSPSPFWVFIFQSTLPTRGSDGEPPADMLALYKFQSTLPTRGSDARRLPLCYSPLYFNPRSPRGGATFFRFCPKSRAAFQSTLPTRGSDAFGSRAFCVANSISIHAPHEGERHDGVTLAFDDGSISIHAPHEGERRVWLVGNSARDGISIHAPHEGERRVRGANPARA